jgi:diacylglycerol kinase family enzyme
VIESEGIAVLLLNFAKIGPGISITHDNNARDGLLEVTVLKPHSAVELLPALIAAMLDRDGGFPGRSDAVETYLSASVRITADPPLWMQYDGETPESLTPLTAHILPGAARLVVTEQLYRSLEETEKPA